MPSPGGSRVRDSGRHITSAVLLTLRRSEKRGSVNVVPSTSTVHDLTASMPRTVAGKKATLPMKPATNASSGSRYIWCGVPICTIFPSFMTIILSDRLIASTRSWVT